MKIELTTNASRSWRENGKTYIAFLRNPQTVEIWQGGIKIKIDISDLNPEKKSKFEFEIPSDLTEMFKKQKAVERKNLKK